MEDAFADVLIASASFILLLFSMMVLVGLMKQAPTVGFTWQNLGYRC